MKLKIELEFETAEELNSLIETRDSIRDAMRDRIGELMQEPLKFSLEGLSRRVVESTNSLTPDQKSMVASLINKG